MRSFKTSRYGPTAVCCSAAIQPPALSSTTSTDGSATGAPAAGSCGSSTSIGARSTFPFSRNPSYPDLSISPSTNNSAARVSRRRATAALCSSWLTRWAESSVLASWRVPRHAQRRDQAVQGGERLDDEWHLGEHDGIDSPDVVRSRLAGRPG